MCVPVHFIARDVTSALNSEFSEDLTIACPGTICYLRQHDILCVRCKVKSRFIFHLFGVTLCFKKYPPL